MKYEKEFIEDLNENNKAQNTIDSYLSDIKIFETFKNESVDNQNVKSIKSYISFLEAESTSPSTINRKIASIKSYITFINQNYNAGIDISKLKQIKICNQDFLDDTITLAEVQRLIKYATKAEDIRAIVIMKLLLLTGGRVSEVIQLKVEDVGNDSATVKGKGSKYRRLLLSKKLTKEIKSYMEVRIDNSKYLLTGQRGAINRQTIHNILKKYAGKARVKLSKAHAHAFRHLYSKILVENNVSYTAIQQLLGHSLTVTMIYTQLDKKELLKIINNINI